MMEAVAEEGRTALPAGTTVGRYRILGHLADGEAGAIYLAESGPAKRKVALRLLHADRRDEGDLVEIFIDETRRALRLSHANVVQTLDLVRTNDQIGAALEYTPGLPVEALYPKGSVQVEITPALVAWIGAEAAAGIAHAHALAGAEGKPRGLVHGDVCPSNIRIGFDGRVRVADFGMARALATLGKIAAPHGPHAYAAPEVVAGGALDPRSDLWGLGVVLWELLARYRLFRKSKDEDTSEAVKTADIPPLDDVRDDVPPELESAIVRALERDLEKRWPSAKEMEQALRATLPRNVEPVREPLVAALVPLRDAYVAQHAEILGRDAKGIPSLGLAPQKGVAARPVSPPTEGTKPYLRATETPAFESKKAATPALPPAPGEKKPAFVAKPREKTVKVEERKAAIPEEPKAAPVEDSFEEMAAPAGPAAPARAEPAVPKAVVPLAPPILPPALAPIEERKAEAAEVEVDMGSLAPPPPPPAAEPKPAAMPKPAAAKPAAAIAIMAPPKDLTSLPASPVAAPSFPTIPPSHPPDGKGTHRASPPPPLPGRGDVRRMGLYAAAGGAVLLLIVLVVGLSSGDAESDDPDRPATSRAETSEPVAAEPRSQPTTASPRPESAAPETTAPAPQTAASRRVALRIESNRAIAWVEVNGGTRQDLPIELTDLEDGATLQVRAGGECCRERTTQIVAGREPMVRVFLPEREDGAEPSTKRRTKRGSTGLAKNPFGD